MNARAKNAPLSLSPCKVLESWLEALQGVEEIQTVWLDNILILIQLLE